MAFWLPAVFIAQFTWRIQLSNSIGNQATFDFNITRTSDKILTKVLCWEQMMNHVTMPTYLSVYISLLSIYLLAHLRLYQGDWRRLGHDWGFKSIKRIESTKFYSSAGQKGPPQAANFKAIRDSTPYHGNSIALWWYSLNSRRSRVPRVFYYASFQDFYLILGLEK